MQTTSKIKICAHSGSSHFIEHRGFWQSIPPKALAGRMPRIEEVQLTACTALSAAISSAP